MVLKNDSFVFHRGLFYIKEKKLISVWTKTHPSAALLRNPKILMYSSKLWFQNFLCLAYWQLFIQTRGFRSGIKLT